MKKSFLFVLVILFALFLSNAVFAFPPSSMVNPDSVQHTPTLPLVKSVVISVLTSNGDTLPPMTLIPGKVYPVGKTGQSIRVSDFYCHWMIKGKPVNFSREEKNPAIRVTVLKNDSVLYNSWAFKTMPYFGMSKMMGHTDNQSQKLYFALLSYDGLSWSKDDEKSKDK